MTEPDRPCLVLMAGLPGSGKSTLARALGTRLGWPIIDKDVILSAMLDDVPERLAQPAAYAVMLALGREMVVTHQRSVILDSPATWQDTVIAARDICQQGNATLRVLLCLADRDTRNERVHTRQAQRSQPAGVSTTIGTGIERFAHLPPDTLQVSTEHDLATSVTTILRHWGRRHG